jgi:hypothetical protein
MSADPAPDQIVDGDETLWRRLPLREDMGTWYTDSNGVPRPTSVAFLDNRSSAERPLDHALSAYLASETDLDRLLREYPRCNVVSFAARIPLSFNHTILRVPEGGYDSHVEITPPRDQWGPEQSKRKQRKTAAREMAKASEWVLMRG